MVRAPTRPATPGSVYKVVRSSRPALEAPHKRRGSKKGIALDREAVVSAFSEDQVERLTGLSKGQLRYWDSTEFFRPTFGVDNRRVAFSRIYSFRDIAALRVLCVLRNQYSVPLQHLRKVAEKLSHLDDAKWTATTLYVINKKVAFDEPDTQKPREVVSGQYVHPFHLKPVIDDTREAVKNLSLRQKEDFGRVEQKRNVSHNLPVVAGTRIPVRAVKHYIEDGFSDEHILAEYPSLTKADIEAVRKYSVNRKVA
jgi:uncharacterized protein (DUF433 family)